MPRPIWKGAVGFGLVSVPVSLHSATRRQAELSFRLLHKKDHAPIDYRRVCSEENVEVDWKDIVKGYEHEKGRFVVMGDEDFAKARTAATQTIEIRDFVPGAAIDAAYFETPYWLEPTKAGRKAYVLLREALARSGRVGIGAFVMRQREHLAALRPADTGLMLTTLRFRDELRGAEDLDLPAGDAVARRELELALRLVESLSSDWDPGRYEDTYHATLRALIERKLAGEEIAAPRGKAPPKVRSLVEALQASLEARPRAPRRAARRKRATQAAA
jgi:DNA end-binding protein Ku